MEVTTKELVRRFIDGDSAAFTELVKRFEKRVYAIAYRMLGNHLDADEVTQETFVRIYEKRQEIKSADYFSSFVMRIATNYSIDLIRRKEKGFVPVDDISIVGELQKEADKRNVSPDQQVENSEILLEVKSAVLRLPPKQRIVVILHDIEGYSKAEIAKALGCPQATVRSNLHIARRKLKKWLAKKFE